jgi:hypothetical protein
VGLNPQNELFECTGCFQTTEAPKRSKFLRELLCFECYQAWDELDRKGQAYLKHIRAKGEFLD